MKLVNVYDIASDLVLYRLLKERPEIANISHRAMPTWEEHKEFLGSWPYAAWYLVMEKDEILGSIYLSPNNEIGVSLFKSHQGKGFARKAIEKLMKLHPKKRYLANISPANKNSIEMFKKHGFSHIQETYEFNA